MRDHSESPESAKRDEAAHPAWRAEMHARMLREDAAAAAAMPAAPARTPPGMPAEGSPAAREFAEVYERAYKLAVRQARGRVDRDEARDVVQEAAMALFERWETLPPEQRTVAYLVGRVRFRSLDAARRSTRAEARRVDLGRLTSTEEDLDDAIDLGYIELRHAMAHDAAMERLELMLGSLPDRQVDAWRHVRGYGWSPAETAAELRVAIKTVRNYVARTDASLRAQLEAMGIRVKLVGSGRARLHVGTLPPIERERDP